MDKRPAPKRPAQAEGSQIPRYGRFHFSRSELIADGAVHAVGIFIAVSAGSVLLALCGFHARPGEYLAAVFYVASLLTVLSISCVYNLLPVSRAKWILRRFDHAAIFLLIAGTYTPFLAQIPDPFTANMMMGIIWGAAALGMAIKIILPGRFDRTAIAFYLAMGWSGVIIFATLASSLPPATLWLIAAGGVIYSTGVVFFVFHKMPYQMAVWHGCVVLGAMLHLSAVMDSLVIARF